MHAPTNGEQWHHACGQYCTRLGIGGHSPHCEGPSPAGSLRLTPTSVSSGDSCWDTVEGL
ncbi:protein of unknown function [Blastococcus saxobsidens DD2]|uniref:Uncharacterized protein n=1 Tax=Blastococcus saxobsidens (strain DD2) TaxID=1146883 RepID=H6RMF6_BLASD|nr:protein of unknown function [Blastococcus saxobsidens DD2]